VSTPTPHPSASRPPSPSRGEGKAGSSFTPETTPSFPSPLEGEGAQRAGEGARSPRSQRLRPFARALRKNATEAETKLWTLLRNRRFSNFKFRRQLPMGPYIIDLVCLERSLVIEVDGSQHAENQVDAARDAWLCERGYRVLRFWNNDVLARPATVMDSIWHSLTEPAPSECTATPITTEPLLSTLIGTTSKLCAANPRSKNHDQP
jgi:very-short-patch-repair endonuclease